MDLQEGRTESDWVKMPWFTRFDEPIKLPGRRPLRTLAEARGYYLELADGERSRVEWKSALALLSEAAMRGGRHNWIACEAVSRALRRRRSLVAE
jgi:hypothetical protein